MIIEYWEVEQLEVYPELDGRQNVVAAVQWCQVIDSPQSVHFNHGWSHLPLPTGEDNFIEYDQLTPQQLVEWARGVITSSDLSKYTATAVDSVSQYAGYTEITVAGLPWEGQ